MANFNKTFWSWRNPRLRAWVYQILILTLLVWGVWYLVGNTIHNLQQRNIASGFEFLGREAGFAIGESIIPYSPTDTFARAIGVGLLNTLLVSICSIVLATIFGILLGIMRLSPFWLLSKLASIYVELIRNIPLLIQLFFWYALITENLPGPRQAITIGNRIFLSNRGLFLPIVQGSSLTPMIIAVVVALLLAFLVYVWALRRQVQTARTFSVVWIALSLIVTLPISAFFFSGSSLNVVVPVLKSFNFQGGLSLSPELFALLVGLVVYTTAYVAEIVRAGIQSVPYGQWQAAKSIGLKRAKVLQLIILPQAFRVIIPPLTSTYLNVTKNSSLAVAIGYPDLVAIVNTTLNQTGQAIESVLIIIAAYLSVSLTISIIMNWYNKRIALRGG